MIPPNASTARRQQARVETWNERLRAIYVCGGLLTVGLLVACLVYSVQATQAAREAAQEARTQSAQNALLLENMKRADGERTAILRDLEAANGREARRFQDLLDLLFPPAGSVHLGQGVVVYRPSTSAPAGRTSSSSSAHHAPSSSSSPAPSSAPRPAPTPPPAPLPSPTSLLPPVPQVCLRILPCLPH